MKKTATETRADDEHTLTEDEIHALTCVNFRNILAKSRAESCGALPIDAPLSASNADGDVGSADAKCEILNLLILERISNTNMEESEGLTRNFIDHYIKMSYEEQKMARMVSFDLLRMLITDYICETVRLVINYDAIYDLTRQEQENIKLAKLSLFGEMSELMVILTSFDELQNGKISVPSCSDIHAKNYNLVSVLIQNLMGTTYNQIGEAQEACY